jgi:hypothetical protein
MTRRIGQEKAKVDVYLSDGRIGGCTDEMPLLVDKDIPVVSVFQAQDIGCQTISG